MARAGRCYAAARDALARGRTLPPPLAFDELHWFRGSESWWKYVLGATIGAIAISFGAPVWFDTLRKVMALRR